MARKKVKGFGDLVNDLYLNAVTANGSRGVILSEKEMGLVWACTPGYSLPEGVATKDWEEILARDYSDRFKIFEQKGEKYYFIAGKKIKKI